MTNTAIQNTIDAWEQAPETAKGRPNATATIDGPQALVEAGPFSWRTDLPVPLGGRNEAPSPTAYLLGALAGCAAVFIRDTLAPQLGVTVTSVKATAQCATDARGLLGMAGAVPDLEDIEVRIAIESSDSQEKVDELYRVWKERCPVYLALTKPLSVKTELSTRASIGTMA